MTGRIARGRGQLCPPCGVVEVDVGIDVVGQVVVWGSWHLRSPTPPGARGPVEQGVGTVGGVAAVVGAPPPSRSSYREDHTGCPLISARSCVDSPDRHLFNSGWGAGLRHTGWDNNSRTAASGQ